MEALEDTVVGLQKDLYNANKQIDALDQKARKAANNGVNKLANQLKLLAGAAISMATIKSIIATGTESIESARRLKALSTGFNEVAEAEDAAARAAKKFGLSGAEANRQFAQIYARLRPLGYELDQIESAFNGFNTAARLSGSTANESAAAWLQLSQALGSGALRGEELNSVFEQTPTVIQGIAEEMNVPIGQIRQLAKDGQITSDIILRALNRLETQGVNQLEESLKGPRQRFKDFENTVATLSDAIAVTILPDLTDAIDSVGEAILLLEGPIKFISGLLANALRQVNLLIQEITLPAAAAARRNLEAGGDGLNLKNALTFGDPRQGLKELFGEEQFDGLIKQAEEYAKLRNQSVKETFKQLALDRLEAMEGDDYIKGPIKTLLQSTNNPLDGNGNGSGGGGRGKRAAAAADRQAQREAERQAKKIKDQEQLLARLEQQIVIAKQITELDRIQEQLNLEILEIEQNYVNEINGETNALILSNAEREKALNLDLARMEAIREMMGPAGDEFANWFKQQPEHAQLFNEELTETEKLLKGSYEIVANGLTSSIKGLIAGTKEWGDVLSDILGQLGQMFLRAGFNGLGAGLGVPGFEGGGYTGNGPRVGGIDGRGGSLAVVHPDETIVDHRSPMGRYNGGNSMSNGGGPLTINFQSHVINNVEYVTKQEAVAMSRAAADDGAKRGTQGGYGKTMKSLQNSRSQRAKLGMS